jgi:hypothetical protein
MMQERRHNQRRANQPMPRFPCRLGNGEFVESDRRHQPDRRLGNISVEEISYEDYISELSRID